MYKVAVEPTSYFHALSDPIRLRIVRLLAASDVEACLCDLSDSIGVPDYKLSRHVKVLRHSGILSAKREGRWIYHKVIRNVASLEHLCAAVLSLPDLDNIYSSDLKKLRRRTTARESARCEKDVPAIARNKRVF